MEVWVVFEGYFLEVDGCSAWTWDFYGIYNSKTKAKEAIASLEKERDGCEVEYKMEKHSVM